MNKIITCLITQVKDTARNGMQWKIDFDKVKILVLSANKFNLPVVILHDDPNFKFDNKDNHNVEFILMPKIVVDKYKWINNPYFIRWCWYYWYLINSTSIKESDVIFFTDATDVEVLRDPFKSNLHIKPGFIYTGVEMKTINDTQWLHNYHTHHIYDSLLYNKYPDEMTLNAGICFGYIDTLIAFLNV